MPRQSARSMWAARLKEGKLVKSPAASPAPVGKRTPFRGLILGIDPSLRGTGLALINFLPSNRTEYVTSETVVPGREANLPECLGAISRAVAALIEAHSPDVVAIEETIYVQNLRTAQKLGAARGAAIGEAARRRIPVFEYPPLRIKQAVVGYGRASKEQVSRQMSGLLRIQEQLPYDEADAAAVALCHALTLGRGVG